MKYREKARPMVVMALRFQVGIARELQPADNEVRASSLPST